jgi:hypothetical protein
MSIMGAEHRGDPAPSGALSGTNAGDHTIQEHYPTEFTLNVQRGDCYDSFEGFKGAHISTPAAITTLNAGKPAARPLRLSIGSER